MSIPPAREQIITILWRFVLIVLKFLQLTLALYNASVKIKHGYHLLRVLHPTVSVAGSHRSSLVRVRGDKLANTLADRSATSVQVFHVIQTGSDAKHRLTAVRTLQLFLGVWYRSHICHFLFLLSRSLTRRQVNTTTARSAPNRLPGECHMQEVTSQRGRPIKMLHGVSRFCPQGGDVAPCRAWWEQCASVPVWGHRDSRAPNKGDRSGVYHLHTAHRRSILLKTVIL